MGGNFSLNGGSFTHNSGTIAFASTTPQTITGSVTFYNFTDTTASSSIRFDDNDSYTYSIAAGGTWTLTGSQGAPVEIRSDSAGNQFTMDFQGSVSFTHVTVKDAGCHASSDTVVVVTESVHNQGNNGTCWVFIDRGNAGTSIGGSGSGSSQTGGGQGGGGGATDGGSGGGSGQTGGGQSGGGATAGAKLAETAASGQSLPRTGVDPNALGLLFALICGVMFGFSWGRKNARAETQESKGFTLS